MEIIAERNSSTKVFQTAMVNMMNSMNVATPKYSVADAMVKLCSMDDFDSSSPEFHYAYLESRYGLKPSLRMSIIEKVGIFVYVLAHDVPNRLILERFQHSGETGSRVFKEVLYVMDGMSRDILVPRDPSFKEVPRYLANDARYMPYFKDCIGAIDGTHISIIVPEEDQLRYKGKKGIPTMNILAVCDFDLLFIYVLTGWEGLAHDSQIFLDTIGKYYIVDKGYSEKKGYLTPYPKTRYHQFEFRGASPRGTKEVFNRANSSIRSCIELSFGVLKARWKILDKNA
ncbi:uncharacterized protein LOC110692032 [Chenopodium quinoa]|uniref:uncharacterized protein LOC110692032 n=1 Tax=Chenopodium quinoa TaxID=63459 RepID=UPI000B797E6E|nr:uncharacterized protein LOC110692032 [Chenopodium quinoa]